MHNKIYTCDAGCACLLLIPSRFLFLKKHLIDSFVRASFIYLAFDVYVDDYVHIFLVYISVRAVAQEQGSIKL
jgi:hypothetical protein